MTENIMHIYLAYYTKSLSKTMRGPAFSPWLKEWRMEKCNYQPILSVTRKNKVNNLEELLPGT